MIPVTFLWFLGVLALASTSEAHLSYTVGDNVIGKSKVYYLTHTAEDIHQKVSESLKAKYHVTCELTSLEMTTLTAEFVALIRNSSSNISLAYRYLEISGLQLSGIIVPNRSFVVRSVGIEPKASGNVLILSIIVPKVEATFSSKNCEIPTKRRSPCTLVYTFENLLVGLKIQWLLGNLTTKPNWAWITSCAFGKIQSRLSFGHLTYPDITMEKKDKLRENIIDRMYGIMPDQSRANNVTTHFAQSLVS